MQHFTEKELKKAKKKARSIAEKSFLTGPREIEFAISCQQEAVGKAHLAFLLDRFPGREEEIAATRRTICKAIRDQGRLEEAAEMDPSYTNIEKAIGARDCDDEDFGCGCKCDKPEGTDRKGRPCVWSVPRWRQVKETYSARHGAYVYLWECTKCGFLNLTPLVPGCMKEILKERGRPRGKGFVPKNDFDLGMTNGR
jgi:hypothetical protein